MAPVLLVNNGFSMLLWGYGTDLTVVLWCLSLASSFRKRGFWIGRSSVTSYPEAIRIQTSAL